MYEIDRDFRFVCKNKNDVVIQIQKIFSFITAQSLIQFTFLFDKQKFILTEIIIEIRENQIHFRIENVILNYDFENFKLNARFIQFQMKQNEDLMKKILNENLKMRSFCQSSLLRTKLKFKTFTRFYFVKKNFFFSKCISMSLFIFIDDFELYRNSYRILMKMYVIVIVFIFKKRNRKINVFFLILELHDSNFSDVIKVLIYLMFLNQNELLIINNEKIFVCVFILIYFDDMSQQQKNAE